MATWSEEDPIGGHEEFLEDAGVLAPLSDSDAVVLFRDLETELERMIKRYHVPSGDMEKLFQVVQSMFEMMCQSQESNEELQQQKNELEELWNAEKEKAKLAQRRKLELECRLEEEKMKTESEKGSLEKRLVDLQTRMKHLTEHKSGVEQDLRRMKERHEKEDQMRKDLVIQYKKQYDSLKRRPGRSKKFHGSLVSRQRSLPPVPQQPWEGREEPGSTLYSQDSLLQSTTSELAVGEPSEAQLTVSAGGRQPLSPGAVSLEEELQETKSASGNGKRSLTTQTDPVSTTAETAIAVSESYSYEEPYYQDQMEMLSSSDEEGYGVGGAKVAPENTEGLSLEDELMAVDPGLFAPARAEMELRQHKKEAWESEREELASEKEALRTEKEVVERQNAQLQLQIDQLKQSRKDLEMEVTEVKRERDEVLENYLDQPFDEYCITRKELYELLKRHQKTAIELEKEKEEKERLQVLLDAKKSLFERFKIRMKQLFSHSEYPRQPSSSSTSSDQRRSRSPTPFDRTMDSNSLSPAPFFSHHSPSPRPSSPLTHSLTPSLLTNFTVVKGWLVPVEEEEGGRVMVPAETLPIWMGQITLKGIETERIECAAVGHVYHSIRGVVPGQVTPAHHQARYSRLNALSWLRQLHTEVWVATSEAGAAYIEVMDVLAKPAKVRQSFILKPKTKHIVCMKAIPGAVEIAHDFTDSAARTVDTSWVEPYYSPPRACTQSLGRGRPHSAPVAHGQRSSPIRIPTKGGDPCPEGGDDRGGPLSRRLEFPLRGSVESARFSTLSEPGMLMAETIDHLRARSNNIHQGMLFRGVIREDPVPSPDSGKTEAEAEPEPDLDLSGMSMEPTASPDGGVPQGRRARSRTQEGTRAGRKGTDCPPGPVMWIITEDDRLCFHPVTHPSHIPLNSIKLKARALCMEYIKDKVYVGHCNSEISVFCKDEFSGSWDIENPDKITLPSSDPSECFDVKCLVGVGDRLWVGAGPSIFFLDTETYTREGSIFMDSWRKRPEQMLAVGDCVVVATKGSALFVFDANSARLLRKFDVAPMTKLLEQSHMRSAASLTTPTDIKSLLMDEKNIYVGTSNGRIVAIPVEKLRDTSSAENAINEATQNDVASEEADGIFQQQSAISLHTHKDDRVKTLLHIQLPPDKPPRKRDRTLHYGSLPNLLSSSQNTLYRASMVTPLIKSLILSVGKGHAEYSVSAGADTVEESSAMRERNEAFQLLIWGHRNTLR